MRLHGHGSPHDEHDEHDGHDDIRLALANCIVIIVAIVTAEGAVTR
jgi:hypothetical protein